MVKYLLTAMFVLVAPCHGTVRLPKLVGSHMVLQQQSHVKIWGWADAGEEIQVAADWLDDAATTTADDDGKWQVQLNTGPAGGPHAMSVEGQNRIELDDILFGEVWIASGQSNMEMPLLEVSGAYTGIDNAAQEVAAADFPDIRLFQVGNFSSKHPLEDVRPGNAMYGVPPAACRWRACTPESIPTFASTAYFFARHLNQQLNVPIGIIDASWGGTSAEAWTPAEGLQRLGYDDELATAADRPQDADQKTPTRLYNGMIHPLRHFKIKGVVWYQGEGNAGRADRYRELFSTMIGMWRQSRGDAISFYFVQIAPFQYQKLNAAYLREAQLQTMSLPATGMVVTLDIGDLQDIHPKNKQEVGRRLALWAMAHDYHRDVVFSGPIYQDHVAEDDKIRVTFAHAGNGLTTFDRQPPSHFEIAGTDREFHPATARIDGEDIVVYSSNVPAPVAVRYAFSSDAMPNLANSSRLPASSFRTDNWPAAVGSSK